MKKTILLLSILLLTNFIYSQSKSDLRQKFDSIVENNQILKKENDILKQELLFIKLNHKNKELNKILTKILKFQIGRSKYEKEIQLIKIRAELKENQYSLDSLKKSLIIR